MGHIYQSQGDWPESLKWYQSSLQAAGEAGDNISIAKAKINIAGIYYSMGNYEEALNNYRVSLQINKETGSKKSAAYCYQGIGNIYLRQGNYQEVRYSRFLYCHRDNQQKSR
jgi:tetratricopeptide (TPR) repeat protein